MTAPFLIFFTFTSNPYKKCYQLVKKPKHVIFQGACSFNRKLTSVFSVAAVVADTAFHITDKGMVFKPGIVISICPRRLYSISVLIPEQLDKENNQQMNK